LISVFLQTNLYPEVVTAGTENCHTPVTKCKEWWRVDSLLVFFVFFNGTIPQPKLTFTNVRLWLPGMSSSVRNNLNLINWNKLVSFMFSQF